MARAFVAIGSNIDQAASVEKAVQLLNRHAAITGLSTVYRTEGIGTPGQAHFYNCVVEIRTSLPPLDLKFRVLRQIESRLGRERTADKYAARTIDLDLVIYDDLVLKSEDLVLPDPEISCRFFIATPLAELAPDLRLPGNGARITDVAAALPMNDAQPLYSYTAQLRRGLGLDKLRMTN